MKKIKNNYIGQKVLVRGTNSGVYYGILKSRTGQEVELVGCRNIWCGSDANNLHQLATEGVQNPQGSKISMTVESIILTDICEIIPCSETDIACMEGLIKAFLDIGYGNGNGSSYGDGIKSINGLKVYNIDNTPTILTRVRGNIAKGYIVKRNVYLEPCYVVKSGEVFARGHTLREAQEALADKLFDDMPEEARLAAFVAAHKDGIAYPNTDFFDWHHKLTGSCKAGREAFAANRGIDLTERDGA